MVQTRIKPYRQQVAENVRRAEQTRVYRRNQIVGLVLVAAVILAAVPHQSWLDLSGRLVATVSSLGTSENAFSAKEPLAVLLLGPTGSGKTALSLALGEQFGRRNRQLRLGRRLSRHGPRHGQADPEERARLPHHLIDVADPDQPFTAGEYSRQARAALHAIAARGRLPIVTGGTGLYLRALTEGLFPGPARQAELRARLERSRKRHGDAWLHRILTASTPSPHLASMPTTCPS
jgi:hypothetical protein